MHCNMLNKECQRTFCMAFRHKEVSDANGCCRMRGYCTHYKKFWYNGSPDKF